MDANDCKICWSFVNILIISHPIPEKILTLGKLCSSLHWWYQVFKILLIFWGSELRSLANFGHTSIQWVLVFRSNVKWASNLHIHTQTLFIWIGCVSGPLISNGDLKKLTSHISKNLLSQLCCTILYRTKIFVMVIKCGLMNLFSLNLA